MAHYFLSEQKAVGTFPNWFPDFMKQKLNQRRNGQTWKPWSSSARVGQTSVTTENSSKTPLQKLRCLRESSASELDDRARLQRVHWQWEAVVEDSHVIDRFNRVGRFVEQSGRGIKHAR